MLISVIIPTCNRNELLVKCLDLLSPANQTIDELYEVIVTDDSKNNIAKSLVKEQYPWAKWIEGPKRGPASNRNYGATFVTSDWVAFIDDDCLPDKNILNNYKRAILNSNGSLAFEGAILPDDWDKMKEDMSECPINTDGGYFWSANICVNKALFDQIRGFDENFLLAAQEDQDIHTRLSQKTKVSFVKDAFLIHPVRKGVLSKKLRQIPVATRNWYIYEKKYNVQTLARIRSKLAEFLIQFAKSSIKDLFKGKVKSAILNLGHLFIGIPVYLTISLKNYRHG